MLFSALAPCHSVLGQNQSIQNSPGEEALQGEFETDYEHFLPGYKVKKAPLEKGNKNSDEALSNQSSSGASFFDRLFSDKTLLNSIILILLFLFFLVYRIRSGKMRR